MGTLSPDALRARLDARVSRRVSPLLWTLGAAFAFFAAVTLVFRPPGATAALAAIDGGGALALGGAALALRGRAFPPRWANAIAAGALLLTLAASLAAIKLLHLPAQTTNVLIVELVGSVILLSAGWTAVLVASSLAGWSAVAWSEGLGDAWLNAGFALVATSLASAMIQLVRLRDARATEELEAANQDKAARLEAAVAAERAHARLLASANDALEAFSYVVSHDLKEPLRGMRIMLEEMEESLDAPKAERADLLARSRRSHEHMERLVKGLLEWSRVSAEPLQPEPLDVAALLRDGATRALFGTLLHERRAQLLVGHDVPRVLGTAGLLRQALGNLILNGIRHNPRDDPQVRVYAAQDAPRGMVDLVVEDNGPGFPQAVLDRVARLQESPSTVKGGFGLAIARRAAQRLGGDLHVENRPDGGGARVHVLLPRAPSGHPGALQEPVRSLA